MWMVISEEPLQTFICTLKTILWKKPKTFKTSKKVVVVLVVLMVWRDNLTLQALHALYSGMPVPWSLGTGSQYVSVYRYPTKLHSLVRALFRL